MKKALKKIAAIFVTLAVLCLAGFIVFRVFFPGLFFYLNVKKDYPGINEKMEEYKYLDVDIPDNFTSIDVGNLSVSGPEEDKLIDNSTQMTQLFRNHKTLLMVNYSEFTDENRSVINAITKKYKDEDYIHFFKSIGFKMPDTNRETMSFYYDTLDSDLCLHLRGKDQEVFNEFAKAKQTLEGFEKVYYYKKDGVEGYLCDQYPDDNSNVFMWSAYLYTGEDQKTENVFVISSDNADVVRQIIASIEPSKQ